MNKFIPPDHWDLLSNDDQQIYREIYNALAAPTNKNKRNTRVDDFKEILDAIDIFENIDDGDKWKRCLVCGIFKIDDLLAVNITQLKFLVMKCKSSINGSLRRLGYGNIIKKEEGCNQIFEVIPFLKTCPSDLRRWTIRYYSAKNKDSELATLCDLKDHEENLQNNEEIITEPEVGFSFEKDQQIRGTNEEVPSVFDDQLSNWDGSNDNDFFDMSLDFSQ